MCGCFVPAEYASFRFGFFLMHHRQASFGFQRRIHDALLTRLSNNDHLERNLSTFASEMASSAMILGSQYYLCPCFSGLMLNTGDRACVSKVSGFGRRVRPRHVTNWRCWNVACNSRRFNSTQSLSIQSPSLPAILIWISLVIRFLCNVLFFVFLEGVSTDILPGILANFQRPYPDNPLLLSMYKFLSGRITLLTRY
jgi:hypothetical protein